MPGGFSFNADAMRARDEINDALSVNQRPNMGQTPPPMPPQPQMGMPPMQPPMSPPMQPQMGLMQPQMQPQMGMAVRPQMQMQMGLMQPQMAVRQPFKKGGAVRGEALDALSAKYAKGGGAWTRKEGKDPEGGLNAKGRASLKAQGQDIKPPVSAKLAAKSPKAAARRKSFCARMGGMEGPMQDDSGKPTRKALALRKWDCKAEGGLAVKDVWDKSRPDDLGKPKSLSTKKKKSAKARAASAGRPYPNLVDNMAASIKKGK
jgi:hypothetical protein